MTGFGLILGHLIGDYIVQNDWMAANKTNDAAPYPGPEGFFEWLKNDGERDEFTPEQVLEFIAYMRQMDKEMLGHLACTIHCFLYTLAVWAFSWWWMPWWGLVVCFLAHWPVDRYRLARWWMTTVSGQEKFATGPLAPWSIIVVDNVFHLATLFVIGVAAGGG